MTSPANAVSETREETEKLQYIEDLTQNCDELQGNVLEEILTQNANTDYLKRFGLEGATDSNRDTFKSKVPVVTYEDILPDIQRIANGDFSPIPCAQPITEFYASSGTSGGESKLIPATAEYRDKRMQFHSIYMPILNRYRVGDVVQVTGFHNSTPKVKFARRKNVLLSIDVDKTNESDMQKAIENASSLLQPFNTSIVEYTSYAGTKAIPGHYVIYLELLIKDPLNGPSRDVLDNCCLEMEEALDTIYRQGRHLKSIGPLEIRVVKNGTFEALMDYAITRGASINQFKMPRCVKLNPMLELLDSNVVSTHFSPSLPHWSL